MSSVHPLGIAVDEIVAEATARLAIDEITAVLCEWDDNVISMGDVLGSLVLVGSLATRAQSKGWDFLERRKRDEP